MIRYYGICIYLSGSALLDRHQDRGLCALPDHQVIFIECSPERPALTVFCNIVRICYNVYTSVEDNTTMMNGLQRVRSGPTAN